MVEEVDKHILRKYDIASKLGKGAYAVVFKAIDKKTKQVVALKKIFDAFQNATDAQRTFREIMYLQEIANHENIIRLQNVHKADNDKDIYLVFDYMETDLHAVIRANILENIHKQYVIYQVLKALKYMHTADLVHRDLKALNGAAGAGDSSVLTDYVATRWYRAPEILLGSTCYTKAVDMWSLGCILAEMLGGKPLFPGTSTMNQLEKILEVTGMPPQADVESIQSAFAATMLQSLPHVRKKNLSTMFNASADAIDLMSRLLEFNPAKRISAQGALEHPYLAQFYTREEASAPHPVSISIDDNVKYTVQDYRDKLYKEVVAKKRANRRFNAQN
ncbi:mitogenactivated protein kinase putative [Pavlovales sp. CCMP2436]|nr:mitogenactivated protein kinase putative [Pavlovales sp. CCMP2436]